MQVPHVLQVTRSCLPLPATDSLPLWCAMAGHWAVREHDLLQRNLSESVMIYCVAGAGWVRVGNRRDPVKPGDLFLCPQAISHGYGCDPKVGWEIHWLHFGGPLAGELCRQAGLGAQRPLLSLGTEPDLLRAFSALRDRLSRDDLQQPWDASALLYSLLLQLVRLSRAGKGSTALVGLVRDDCESLDELVHRSGYSKYHFCRLFKKETGRSPWQYVTERRIERSKELLLDTRLSIKEIAAHLGFNTPDYFAKLFTRHAGVTPSQFRGK